MPYQSSPPIDFDAMLPYIGEMGRYQLGLYLLMCIPATLPAAFLAFNQVFLLAEPDHWCRVPSLEVSWHNLSQDHIKALSIPMVKLGRYQGKDIEFYERCKRYDVNFTEVFQSNGNTWPDKADPGWPKTKCKDGWVYDKSEYESTLVTELDLVCDKQWWPSTSTSLFYVGSLFGNIMFGCMADRHGRRTAFFCLLFINVTLAIISSFSPNYIVFTILRTVNGFTFPALFQIPFILTFETMGPGYHTFAGMMICLFFACSLMILAGLAYIFNSWYDLARVTSFPFIILFSYWFFVPESPRWLLSFGRIDEAEVIIQNIAKWNKKVIPPNFVRTFAEKNQQSFNQQHQNNSVSTANDVLSVANASSSPTTPTATPTTTPTPITAAPQANSHGRSRSGVGRCCCCIGGGSGDDGHSPASSPGPRSPKRSSRKPSMFVLLLYYPIARRNFMLITFNWLANAIVYNGLSFYSANLNVNSFLGFFISSAVEIPSYFIGWYAMDKWGRRWILFATMTTGGIAGICCIFLPLGASPWITVILAMIGKFQIAASFAVIYVYAGELMPTVVRSEAMGISSFVSGIGLLIFPYINDLGKYNHVLPLVIMGTLSVMGGVTALFLPETLWKHLPNTLDEGETFNSSFEIFSCPKKSYTAEDARRASVAAAAAAGAGPTAETEMAEDEGEGEGEETFFLNDMQCQQPNGKIGSGTTTTMSTAV